MKLKELRKPLTAKALNESLAKTFGQRIAIEKFTNEQLEDARNRLRTQLSQVEMSEKFESVNTSDTYQKAKMFLDVINAEISERETNEAKPDFLDMDKDGDKKEPMKKAIKDKESGKDSGMSDKQKKYFGKKDESVVKEGAEEEATLVMAAKDMVDRITGWMEDTAEMQTESMLELGDKIRDELGSEVSEQFVNTVKPALESLYTTFETTRDALTSGVAIVTGEGGPETMPGAEGEAPAEEPAMEPTVDQEAGAEEPVADEFAASEPATGGEETADRAKRESVLRSRRLGQLLTDSKKKGLTLSEEEEPSKNILIKVLRNMIGSADNQDQPAYLSWDALNQIMRNMKAPQFDFDGFKMIYDANPDIQPLIKNFDDKGLTLATKTDSEEPMTGGEEPADGEVDQMAQRATDNALS